MPTRTEPRCTGIAAVWCPIHGDCSCPRIETGERSLEDASCPLHSASSTHAEQADDATPAESELAQAHKLIGAMERGGRDLIRQRDWLQARMRELRARVRESEAGRGMVPGQSLHLVTGADKAVLDAMARVSDMRVRWFAMYSHPVWRAEFARRGLKP